MTTRYAEIFCESLHESSEQPVQRTKKLNLPFLKQFLRLSLLSVCHILRFLYDDRR